MFKRCLPILLLTVLLTAMSQAQANRLIIDGEEFFDPTQPPGMQLQEPDGNVQPTRPGLTSVLRRNYTVSFIRAGGSRPLAVINNKRVGIGDEVDGARVLAIGADSVSLQVGGGQRVVSTWSNPVRQPVDSVNHD